MNEIPFFSIIVPVYNIEKYLERTITSLLENTFNDYEIIIVNDGSTDNSLNILNNYSGNTKLVILSQQNGGLSSARNLGLNNAKGQYVIFVDGDDYITKDALLIIHNAIINKPVDLLVFGRIFNYGEKKVIPYKLENEVFSSPEEYLRKSLQHSKYRTNVWDKVYRRDLIEKNNLRFINGLLYEDMFFLLQYLSYSNDVSVIPDALYLYTLNNEESITKSFREKDLDVLLYLDKAVSFVNKTTSLTKKSCYTMLQRFSLSSIVKKYMNFYKHNDIARYILNSLFNDKNFKRIIKFNDLHGISMSDRLSAFLIRIHYRLYLFIVMFLKSLKRNER